MNINWPLKYKCWTLLLAIACWPGLIFGRTSPATPGGQDPDRNPLKGVQLGILDSDRIPESSGLIGSRRYPQHYWTINDSGHGSEVFLIAAGGKLKASVQLLGARNVDWESLTWVDVGQRRLVVVGDVGDNLQRRNSCQLYWFAEPQLELGAERPVAVNAAKIEFRYADRRINCEAIASLPGTNEIWLIEKAPMGGPGEWLQKRPRPAVYSLQVDFSNHANPQLQVAKRAGTIGLRQVTGMDFSPDGKRLLVRSYFSAQLFERKNPQQSWAEVLARHAHRPVVLPMQRQGEAVCFWPNGDSIILTSEFRKQPIWRVPITGEAADSSRPSGDQR